MTNKRKKKTSVFSKRKKKKSDTIAPCEIEPFNDIMSYETISTSAITDYFKPFSSDGLFCDKVKHTDGYTLTDHITSLMLIRPIYKQVDGVFIGELVCSSLETRLLKFSEQVSNFLLLGIGEQELKEVTRFRYKGYSIF